MRLSLLRSSTCVLLLALLAGCAMGVRQVPTDITPAAASASRIVITIDKQADLILDTQYLRTLKAGSQWERIGRIAQGDVYKPHNDIFTVEGKHVHEACLVIAGTVLTGFYLPAERSYSSIRSLPSLTFTSTSQ